MLEKLRYLLLQVRNHDDPMRDQEVRCFVRALGCENGQIDPFDFLRAAPSRHVLDAIDVVLLGGSGHYGAVEEESWLERALDSLRDCYFSAKPTFASCWGFQAMSRAMGGVVVKDLDRAEVGTHALSLTAAGRKDPVFGFLTEPFHAQLGHEDYVVQVPDDAVVLASSAKIEKQAFRFDNKPIYCTQFHPELNRANLLERLRAYPEYVERITGNSFYEVADACRDTPQTEALLSRFVKFVFA